MQGHISGRSLPKLARRRVEILIMSLLIILAAECRAENVINLEFGGAPGTAYSAHWTLENAGQIREYQEQHGRVPARYSYSGDAISGTVTLLSSGQLTLNVEKSGNRSRSATQGRGSTLHFSIR